MPDIPIAALKAVAERMNALGLDYAFLGGSIVGLLLDFRIRSSTGVPRRFERRNYGCGKTVFTGGRGGIGGSDLLFGVSAYPPKPEPNEAVSATSPAE
jgi:hypothetical protein